MQYSSMIGWSEFPHQIIHVHHARPICGTPCLFTPDCGEVYI